MTVSPLKLGFLASRNGSSLRAIMAAIEAGTLAAEARLVVSNTRAAPALSFARDHGVAAQAIATQADPDAADARLCEALQAAGVELVVLSGYLRRLGPRTLGAYRNRVLNIHPGPLPRFGGEGMYGRRVHEAVIGSGATESGVTIHLVDEIYDNGPLIAARAVPLSPGETANSLEARITELEPQFFVETLRRLASGDLALPD
ncbi:formyltransferase family protein [Phenylobacterium sp.]|uniref:phosphoribosylglycinamide formyltransferase n=1 Tax=Phenylobacterium sp. TaxID=1871053 RepID=UPI00286A9A11|nr:formyltransferase family protein [Phenylobacterium sp.]